MLEKDLIETHYKIEVKDITSRRRVVKDNLKKPVKHQEQYKVKGRFRLWPVLLLDIDIPLYHLNNDRTKAAQSSFIYDEEKPNNWFSDHREDQKQQKIQHKFLFQLSKDSTANVYLDFKKSAKFREDRPLLIDGTGMVINGNRRLSAVRELYKLDEKKYKNFKQVPCAVIDEHLDQRDIKDIEYNLQVVKENKQEYDWISLCLAIQKNIDVLKWNFKEVATKMEKAEKAIRMDYELIQQIDKHLAAQRKEKAYHLLEKQQQLWKDSSKKAETCKTEGEKEAVWKLARIISKNSGELEDRDYKIASQIQKKSNLQESINYLAKREHIKPKKIKNVDEDDPIEQSPATSNSKINLSVVHQIPEKKDYKKVILALYDYVGAKANLSAAKTYSEQALGKIESMWNLTLPEKHREEIKRNLKKIVNKSEILIDKCKIKK
jgi:hypothetical protein|tara:strand:+ start:474 stop:1775 length:1302 start_codon:yes stop_codon:yes gene_type:complete